MADQPVFLPNRSMTPPPMAPPQVVLTLVNNQTQLGSNIAPGPQTWRVIAQMCLQGAMAALNELSKDVEHKDGPRIVVPAFQVKGGVAG